MTWLSTWPEDGIPMYAEHPTETAAEQHAKTKDRPGTRAVHFWATERDETP